METREGKRSAVVVAPTRPIVADRSRLQQLRLAGGRTLTPVDVEFLRLVSSITPAPNVVIFRQVSNDGSGHWSISDDLDDEEVQELGQLLMREHLLLYRALMENGIRLFIYSEWQDRSRDMLRAGLQEVLDQIAALPSPSSVDLLNGWILRNLVFFFALDPIEAVDRVLTNLMPMVESSAPKINTMLQDAARVAS